MQLGGQVEVGAGSRKTGVCLLSAWVFILGALGQACSIEQPVSGAVLLTSDWKTIDPPESLRVAGKYEQKVCLQIVGAPTDVKFEKGTVQVDGQWHVLEGEAVDHEQTSYGLALAELGGTTACLYRAADTPPGPDFPAHQTLVRLRLRSVPPLQVDKIWWISSDPH
jgi:hypothetical protein